MTDPSQARAFVARRAPVWEQLEMLVQRASRRGLRSLDAAELFELGRLYRCVTSDLAYAQGRGVDERTLRYLNRLVARAHAYVYGGSVETGWPRFARFFTQTFPRELRRSFPFVLACIALTIAWACVAYVIVRRDPSAATALLPEWLVPAHITKSLHNSNFAFAPSQSAAMSSFIITNNVKVAILTFAGGVVTAGAFTIYLIVFNALMLGALGALYTNAGFGPDFWATIAPHGFIELTAIQIAGGAGLLLAAAILVPGRMRRADAIAAAGARAATLAGGVIAMLCVAGTIEGFFSPLRYPAQTRIAVGFVSAVAMIAYFVLCGRGRASTADRAA